MTAAERLLAWARKQPCIYRKCVKTVVAMTATTTTPGYLDFLCADHAAACRKAGVELIELPPLSGDVERARDSRARRRPTGPQVT